MRVLCVSARNAALRQVLAETQRTRKDAKSKAHVPRTSFRHRRHAHERRAWPRLPPRDPRRPRIRVRHRRPHRPDALRRQDRPRDPSRSARARGYSRKRNSSPCRTGKPDSSSSHRLSAEAPLFACCPGAEQLLQRLDEDTRFDLSVLTGNLERMAGVKLAAVGLDRHIRLRGAYGSDHENRNELPAIAAARIAEQTGQDRPPADFMIIGDTPRDIEAARGFGMRCMAVATGHYSLDALAAHEPDVLLADLSDTDLVMDSLLG
ncbi:MAG: HAD hydrolase-like protein [Blastocatellia bacterium]|nr:HAD hydrolase-like protein [Blastocatellia bacterium]